MTNPTTIARSLSEAQRRTLASSKPLIDARILVPTHVERKRWPAGMIDIYSVAFRRLTEQGKAVRAAILAEKEGGA